MSRVFVDTVGLLARWNESDQWHGPACAAFSALVESRSTLLTTTFVLLECGNAVARTRFRDEAVNLREEFEAARALVWPTESDWNLAWEAFERGEADAAGIVDQISFVVMRRLGIAQAFTNDRHFRSAGFETLF